jgi:type I restriction enzyme, S subunit
VNLPEGWTIANVDELAGSTGLVADGDWVESKDQDSEGGVRLVQLAQGASCVRKSLIGCGALT